MRFVLDASVAVKWVLPEQDTLKALKVRDDLLAGIHEFFAPDTYPVEIAHALTRAERRRAIKQHEAILKLSDVLTTSPQLIGYLPLLDVAARLSSLYRVGVYDCLYLAVADLEQCNIVTADQRLKAVGHPRVTLLADYP